MIALAAIALAAAAVRPADEVWRECAPVPPVGAPERGRIAGSFEALQAALSDLALEHGERVRLWTYGRSGGDRGLSAVEVFDPALGWDPEAGPTLIVVPDLARDARASAAEILSLADRLVEDEALVAGARWLLLPAPLPDRLEERGEESTIAARPEWDFPVGWHPWTTPGAGPYPLYFPETRALARALDARGHGIAAVLVIGGEPRDGGGSFSAFVRGRGLGLARLPSSEVGPVRTARGLLPRARLEVGAIERLGVELWQVELAVARVGSRPRAAHEIVLDGAQLFGAARLERGAARPLAADRGRSAVGIRGPAANVVIRLLVRGEEGALAGAVLGGRGLAPVRCEWRLARAGTEEVSAPDPLSRAEGALAAGEPRAGD